MKMEGPALTPSWICWAVQINWWGKCTEDGYYPLQLTNTPRVYWGQTLHLHSISLHPYNERTVRMYR